MIDITSYIEDCALNYLSEPTKPFLCYSITTTAATTTATQYQHHQQQGSHQHQNQYFHGIHMIIAVVVMVVSFRIMSTIIMMMIQSYVEIVTIICLEIIDPLSSIVIGYFHS
jgi:uncharacterized membrane protein YidH (DUF202 family)